MPLAIEAIVHVQIMLKHISITKTQYVVTLILVERCRIVCVVMMLLTAVALVTWHHIWRTQGTYYGVRWSTQGTYFGFWWSGCWGWTCKQKEINYLIIHDATCCIFFFSFRHYWTMSRSHSTSNKSNVNIPSNVVNGVRVASNFSWAQASSKRDVMLPICNSTTCVSRRCITKHKKPVLLRNIEIEGIEHNFDTSLYILTAQTHANTHTHTHEILLNIVIKL